MQLLNRCNISGKLIPYTSWQFWMIQCWIDPLPHQAPLISRFLEQSYRAICYQGRTAIDGSACLLKCHCGIDFKIFVKLQTEWYESIGGRDAIALQSSAWGLRAWSDRLAGYLSEPCCIHVYLRVTQSCSRPPIMGLHMLMVLMGLTTTSCIGVTFSIAYTMYNLLLPWLRVPSQGAIQISANGVSTSAVSQRLATTQP